MKSVLRGLLFLLGSLPLPVLHGLGALLGSVLAVVPNSYRGLAWLHLQICLPELPERERRRILRASLRHMGMAVAEAAAIWFGPRWRLARWLDDAATRAQLQELARNGAVILCPHVGSWELAGMFCAGAGPITSLYKEQWGVFEELIKEGRERLGARLAPSTIHGVKALMEALRRGEMIGILPDQDPPPGSGVFAPLFGVPAHTTALVGKLAARARAPVWFCVAERLPGRGFRFHLQPAPEGVTDPATGPAALNRGIEECLRRFPGQYWWSYRRFRRRPPGMREIYGGRSANRDYARLADRARNG
jgi:Kdo2-lipid IVA lauroyltransferase/acyltransferase